MMHRTCNIMIVSAALIAGLLGVNVASAGTIINSRHDFSTGNTSADAHFVNVFYTMKDGWPYYIDEICIFCHTPHSAANPSTAPYLWNRVDSQADSFTMYTSSTASTGVVAGPTGISMMCMSCHDGVTSLAVNTLMNPSTGISVDTSGGMTAPGAIGNAYGGVGGWGANLGEVTPFTPGPKNVNLSNDHPISFTWNYSKPGSLFMGGTQDSRLRLFNGKLECATCHLVHDPSIPPFLAMSNADSAMCLSCHDK
jgi:hypothetical protein